MIWKKVEIQFNEYASETYRKLQVSIVDNRKRQNPTYKQLFNSINQIIFNLKISPYYGDLIPKKYLTKQIIEKYKTNKIFRMELVGYWRFLYTVIGYDSSIVVLILDFMDHERYNRLFGYKKR